MSWHNWWSACNPLKITKFSVLHVFQVEANSTISFDCFAWTLSQKHITIIQRYSKRQITSRQLYRNQKWAATWQNQQSECAPSEDSDQPGHPPSLIRVLAVRMKQAWALSYPLSAQRRLWSDWADAQADLSLRWAHTHFVGFVMRRLIFAFILINFFLVQRICSSHRMYKHENNVIIQHDFYNFPSSLSDCCFKPGRH